MKNLLIGLLVLGSLSSFANFETFNFRVYGKILLHEQQPQQQQLQLRQDANAFDLAEYARHNANLLFFSTNVDEVPNPQVQSIECGNNSQINYLNSTATNLSYFSINEDECYKLVSCINKLGSNNKVFYTELTVEVKNKRIIDIDWSEKCENLDNLDNLEFY